MLMVESAARMRCSNSASQRFVKGLSKAIRPNSCRRIAFEYWLTDGRCAGYVSKFSVICEKVDGVDEVDEVDEANEVDEASKPQAETLRATSLQNLETLFTIGIKKSTPRFF